MRTLILISFLLTIPFFSAEAQVLKKLKKKVQEKVEEKIIDRTSDEAAERADKEMDKVFEKQEDGSNKRFNGDGFLGMGSIDDLPENYSFDWRYDLEITSRDEEPLPISYYLKKDSDYMGMTYEDEKSGGINMVMDFGRQLMAMFMDDEKNGKTALVTKMNFEQITATDGDDYNKTYTFEITPLDDKTILGYKCKGYRVEDEEGISKVYITTDAPIGFFDFFSGSKVFPKSARQEWISQMAEGLFMEMDYQSKKKKKHNFTMTCTALEQEARTISKAGYKSMMDVE